MKSFRMRKGSAVVMTLGILAFTLTAAVAFAIFMRQARLPSSYLRRISSTHLMAKAGLAEAIEQLDRALDNSPGPGLGGDHNTWTNRVFSMGATLPIDETANVIPFEGLAYLPPMLVNGIRHSARVTSTAKWQSLPYDAGRYAYVCVDLNGLLDVNRLFANRARSSSSCSRITLSYLFEPSDAGENPTRSHYESNTSQEDWDTLFQKVRVADEWPNLRWDQGHVWLNSIADYNLLLNGSKFSKGSLLECPIQSFFCRYCTSGSSSAGGFYGASDDYMELEAIMRNCFTTESMPAVRISDEEAMDSGLLASGDSRFWCLNGDGQPFTRSFMLADNHPLKGPVIGSTSVDCFNYPKGMKAAENPWLRRLSGLGCAMLADYLDCDRQPISLAIPTCERIPMITGMQLDIPNFNYTLNWQTTREKSEARIGPVNEDGTKTVSVKLKYYLDMDSIHSQLSQGHLRTSLVYPFARPIEDEGKYQVDGAVMIFFSTEEMGLRTYGDAADLLHPEKVFKDKYDPKTGIFWMKLQPEKLKQKNQIAEEEDAIKFGNETSKKFRLSEFARIYATEFSDPIFELDLQYKQHSTGQNQFGPSFEEWLDNPALAPYQVTRAASKIKAVKADGTLDERFSSPEKLLAAVTGANAPELRLNFATVVRVIDTDTSHCVDMVPACYDDDSIQNPSIAPMDPMMKREAQKTFGGMPFPLMKFGTDVAFTLSMDGMAHLKAEPRQAKITPAAVICRDPRFNHAPENWCVLNLPDGQKYDGDLWLKNCGCSNGDGDIFMATSDAGYLQSKYELAFLPAITDLRNYASHGGSIQHGDYQCPPLEARGRIMTFANAGSELNHHLMWRTYDPNGNEGGAFAQFPFVSEGRGYKLYPYSSPQDGYWTNAFMAAFANTPLDWRHSSTNEFEGGLTYCASRAADKMTATYFNKKFAWNAYSDGGKFYWPDLLKVAGKLHDGFMATKNWEQAYDDLDWSFYEDSFLGLNLDDTFDENLLWSTDRKFFYGYWRECFADSFYRTPPQFFLFFIRAEPELMGGNEVRVTAPQLSARAVAIVMRDPHSPRQSGQTRPPHRGRIVYYQQFE